MNNWTTRLQLNTSSENIDMETINIKRGIFQGDSLSPLWFCLALNPLSNKLNTSGIGYILKYKNSTDLSSGKYYINHLLYMDDIKLYAQNQEDINKLAEITENVSSDIGMEFGIDKCKINSVRSGKLHKRSYETQTGQTIDSLDESETYKYLGYNQSKLIQHKTIKTLKQ
ncbi:unnamed protein product [Euphydryas editha]|uniref:Reverse transcriptase domain-containing protein n=1 Tax=Euphydryas editha TaxID=104508 RepID=A0AAU9TXY5_EUPED|nr:unnamed protein product [Euphydryas editha]